MNRYLYPTFKRPNKPLPSFDAGDRVFTKNSGGRWGIVMESYGPEFFVNFSRSGMIKFQWNDPDTPLHKDRKCKCGHWESEHEPVPAITHGECWTSGCTCTEFKP